VLCCLKLSEDSPWKIHNVWVFNLMVLCYILFYTIACGSTFDAYLLELAKSRGESADFANTFVGSVESISGLVSLFAAVPLGWLADKVNKRKMMMSCMVPGSIGIAILFFGIMRDSVPLIYAGIVLQALHGQVLSSSASPLLADSVPKGPNHDKILQEVVTTNGAVFAVASGLGPLFQIILIQVVGDQWTLPQLHIFCGAGFVVWPVVFFVTYMLKPTVSELEAREALAEPLAAQAEPEAVQAPPADGATAPAAPTSPTAAGASITPENAWKEEVMLGIKKKWLAPLIVEFCGLITAVGAGMTVKFFPLFFKEDYNFSPTAFCALTVSYSFAIGLFVSVFQKIGKKIGTIRAAVICHFLGTACLFIMWKLESLVPLIIVFILRGGIMNAKGPIDGGIVMLCVDAKFRGRWSALQTVSRVSWAGSAALGGWLADSHDYRYTFLITGFLYLSSGFLYLPLMLVLPSDFGKDKQQPVDDSSSEQADSLHLSAEKGKDGRLRVTCKRAGVSTDFSDLDPQEKLSGLMSRIEKQMQPKNGGWQVFVREANQDYKSKESLSLAEFFSADLEASC